MRKRKMLVAIFALLVVTLSAPSTIYAGGISIQSTSLPTSTWNLSTKGIYSFAGKADNQDLYSNYLFTGATKTQIQCTNKRTDKNLKVQLVRDDPYFDTAVSTVNVPKNGSSNWNVTGLSSSSKYYLRFYAPCEFNGYIAKI